MWQCPCVARDAEALEEPAPGSAAFYHARARRRRGRGELEACLADLNTARQLTGSVEELALILNDRACTRKLQNDYFGALADYDAAAETFPSAAVFNDRALLHAALGNDDRALQDYDRALELDAAFAIAQYNRERLLRRRPRSPRGRRPAPMPSLLTSTPPRSEAEVAAARKEAEATCGDTDALAPRAVVAAQEEPVLCKARVRSLVVEPPPREAAWLGGWLPECLSRSRSKATISPRPLFWDCEPLTERHLSAPRPRSRAPRAATQRRAER